jgi:hypothetical protein
MAKYDRKRKEQIWQNCSVSSWVLQLMTKQERFSKSPGKLKNLLLAQSTAELSLRPFKTHKNRRKVDREID